MHTTNAPNRIEFDAPASARFTRVETPTHLIGWLPWIWTHVLFGGSAAEPTRFDVRSFSWLFVLSGLLLYPCLAFHLFEPDEGRYAQIPREMLLANEWIVPTLQGEPYLDKPPLFYWSVMLAYSLFGCKIWVARLVPALVMQATVLASYALGRQLVGERSAFWGSLLLTVSPFFLGVGRLLVLDGMLTLWIVLAGILAYMAQREAKLHWTLWLASALMCGLGVLTKGPVAILLVVPPLVVHRWLAGESSRIGIVGWCVYLATTLAVSLPWYVAVCLARPEFVRYFLLKHNVQRFVEPFDHVRPVWFFVPIVALAILPVLLFAKPVARFFGSTNAAETNARCPAMGYLLLASFWCVAFFSLAGSKLPTYILPAIPPLCLTLGCFIARIGWHRSRTLIDVFAAFWLVSAGMHWLVVPIYAADRAPMRNTAEMRARCSDPSVPVYCFPRNIDSVAFGVERSDLRTFRSKDVAKLIVELEKYPRSVVLFGHRSSPELLLHHLPSTLRMIERSPMGLCEVATVVRVE